MSPLHSYQSVLVNENQLNIMNLEEFKDNFQGNNHAKLSTNHIHLQSE